MAERLSQDLLELVVAQPHGADGVRMGVAMALVCKAWVPLLRSRLFWQRVLVERVLGARWRLQATLPRLVVLAHELLLRHLQSSACEHRAAWLVEAPLPKPWQQPHGGRRRVPGDTHHMLKANCYLLDGMFPYAATFAPASGTGTTHVALMLNCGALVRVTFEFSPEYPFEAPAIRFKTWSGGAVRGLQHACIDANGVFQHPESDWTAALGTASQLICAQAHIGDCIVDSRASLRESIDQEGRFFYPDGDALGDRAWPSMEGVDRGRGACSLRSMCESPVDLELAILVQERIGANAARAFARSAREGGWGSLVSFSGLY
jgi:hypothetical protein